MFRPKTWPLSLLVGAGFLFLLVSAALGTWLLSQKREAEIWVEHTFEVSDQLAQLRIVMLRAEVYRRGYVLTGDLKSRAEVEALRVQVAPALDKLRAMTSDNAAQQVRLRAMSLLLGERIAEMSASMDLVQSGQHSAAAALIATEASQTRFARWSSLAQAIDAEERRLLVTRRTEAHALEAPVRLALVMSSLLTLILGLLVTYERRQRSAAMHDLTETLREDIVRREALEVEIEAARARAEAAVSAKASFLANMSHEIRTPMNGVLGFADLLLFSGLSPDQKRHAQLIVDSGKTMMRLLNDILDLSKIEAGQMQIAPERIDLRHALRNCIKLMQPAADQKGLHLSYDVDAALPIFVSVDGLRLRQIILNLVGNAIKFTQNGEVRLCATHLEVGASEWISIDVSDTGIGIAPDRQGAIFGHFVQAEDVTARRYGGSGLGLSISSQLAELMNGQLSLRSKPGEGATFTLRLPLVHADQGVGIGTGAEIESPHDGQPLRILLAEDHDINQALMEATLVRLGHQVTIAGDGAQAVEAALRAEKEGSPFDLVLMDMQMPVMDGLRATRAIRSAGLDKAKLPILALTANAYADDVSACFDAGMQAHIAKPVQVAELSAAIRKWVAKQPLHSPNTGDIPITPSLQARFEARKLELLACADRMGGADLLGDADVQELRGLLHKLAGTAGMFNQPTLGAKASDLEHALEHASPAEQRGLAQEVAQTLRAAG